MMQRGHAIRVLIVDDSAMMRNVLRSVVAADTSLDVAGTAVDGATALQSVAVLKPDVVLLDMEMPVMDGLTTLKKLRTSDARLPVIMVSSLTQRGARVTIDALASGASDYVTKPAAQTSREAAVKALSNAILPRIHALTRAAQSDAARTSSARTASGVTASGERPAPAVVAIGVSTGGPTALEQLLTCLPAHFPLPVVVVQHMPEMFTGFLAERLDHACSLHVVEAADGDVLTPGKVFVARGGRHLEVSPAVGNAKQPILRLTMGPEENHCRPSVDVMFRSLAAVFGGRVAAVVLTGMGSDGLAGCRVLRRVGATILAQDEASSTVWGMPGAVAAEGLADRVLPLSQMGREILRIAGAPRTTDAMLREAVI